MTKELSRIDLGNITRLEKCIKPTQDKINRMRAKLATHIESVNKEIEAEEESIKMYKNMIAQIVGVSYNQWLVEKAKNEVTDTQPTITSNPIEEPIYLSAEDNGYDNDPVYQGDPQTEPNEVIIEEENLPETDQPVDLSTNPFKA